MLRAPEVQARKKRREQAMLDGENNVEETEELAQPPPAKRTRRDKRTTNPDAHPQRPQKKSKRIASQDIPKIITKVFYNWKYRGRLAPACPVGHGTKDNKAKVSENNERDYTKKRRRLRKRQAKRDQDEPVRNVQRLDEHVENEDEGVGSLAVLMDDMRVEERPRAARTATVTSSFNHLQLVQWTGSNWREELRQTAAMIVQRTAVLADEIPIAMFINIDEKLKEFFAGCGPVAKFGIPEFSDTGPIFRILVHFDAEHAALKALELDLSPFGEGFIRVQRPGAPEPFSRHHQTPGPKM